MRRTLGMVALVVALIGVVAVIVWVARQPRGPVSPDSAVKIPDKPTPPIEVSGGEIVERDEDGKILWRAKFGGVIEIDEQGRSLQHTDVVWELERDGVTDISVKAPVMRADYNARLLTFSEGVDITADDGAARFVVDDLRYEFDTDKLIGEGEVAFRYGGFALTGSRLVIDHANDKVRVTDGTLSFE